MKTILSTRPSVMTVHAIARTVSSRRLFIVTGLAIVFVVLSPSTVWAAAFGAAGGGTGGAEFQALYTWIFAAATGYLGRSIAIIGGVIGLGLGAGMGKALPAVIGVFLALFGVLGPVIVDAIFTSAVI